MDSPASTIRIRNESTGPPMNPEKAPYEGADEDRHDRGGEPDLQRGLAADHQPAELVVAEVVAAEQVRADWAGTAYWSGWCAPGRCGR